MGLVAETKTHLDMQLWEEYKGLVDSMLQRTGGDWDAIARISGHESGKDAKRAYESGRIKRAHVVLLRAASGIARNATSTAVEAPKGERHLSAVPIVNSRPRVLVAPKSEKEAPKAESDPAKKDATAEAPSSNDADSLSEEERDRFLKVASWMNTERKLTWTQIGEKAGYQSSAGIHMARKGFMSRPRYEDLMAFAAEIGADVSSIVRNYTVPERKRRKKSAEKAETKTTGRRKASSSSKVEQVQEPARKRRRRPGKLVEEQIERYWTWVNDLHSPPYEVPMVHIASMAGYSNGAALKAAWENKRDPGMSRYRQLSEAMKEFKEKALATAEAPTVAPKGVFAAKKETAHGIDLLVNDARKDLINAAIKLKQAADRMQWYSAGPWESVVDEVKSIVKKVEGSRFTTV